MKKHLLFLLAVTGILFTACEAGGTNEGDNGQPAQPKKIATVEEQSVNIAATITTLETTKSALNTALASLKDNQPVTRGSDNGVKEMIAALEERIAALEEIISNLQNYTDEELSQSTDWLNTTFATLEQQEALAKELAELKALLAAISDVSTEAINNAIAESETSMKSWVNEQLSSYCTVAGVDAQIAALKESVAAEMQEELDAIIATLTTLKSQIEEGYKSAITEAITQFEGVITDKIAVEIATVNQRIDDELATINSRLDAIEKRLDEIEDILAQLVSRIQSVIYWGADDPVAVASVEGKFLDLVYAIRPIDAIPYVAQAWHDVLSVRAICSGETEAVNLPILNCETNLENGFIKLTVSCENLNDTFWFGGSNVRVVLKIDDGNNNLETQPITITPRIDKIFASEITSIPADNEIYYLTDNGNAIPLDNINNFGANLELSYFDLYNGWYVLKFDGAIHTIAKKAFQASDPNNSSIAKLTAIVLPSGITSIGDYAFYSCTTLKRINIPKGVTNIGKDAFYSCPIERTDIVDLSAWCRINFASTQSNPRSSLYINGEELTKLTIPNDITIVNNGAFHACKSITEVEIHDNVKSIGTSAFYSCPKLEKLTLGRGVESINNLAFAYCRALTNIVIPNNVKTLGNDAFKECSGCQSIKVGSGVEFFGTSVFYNCTGELVIDNNIVELDFSSSDYPSSASGWLYLSKFSKIVLSNDISMVGSYAFYGLESIVDVTMSNSITSIEERAFMNCSSLASIDIPATVSSIGSSAFHGCSSLETVILPNGITSLANSIFQNCSNLKSITIPNSVTSIKSAAFYDCASLANIVIPESIEEIGKNAFYGCTSLISITIPKSVISTSFDNAMFGGCKGELIIDNAIVEKNYSSSKCPILTTWLKGSDFTKITIGNIITKIGSNKFKDGSTITEVSIPDSVTSIGQDAFNGCSSLSKVCYNGDLSSWCKIVFSNSAANPLAVGGALCVGGNIVEDLIIPSDITEVKFASFRGCSSIKSVVIHDGIQTVGGHAFHDCESLEAITIGSGVTSIGIQAFYNCKKVAAVYCKPTTPPTGNEKMFTLTDDSRIYVPNDSVEAYKSAEYWSGYANYIVGYDF